MVIPECLRQAGSPGQRILLGILKVNVFLWSHFARWKPFPDFGARPKILSKFMQFCMNRLAADLLSIRIGCPGIPELSNKCCANSITHWRCIDS